jgi:hypothetical protein
MEEYRIGFCIINQKDTEPEEEAGKDKMLESRGGALRFVFGTSRIRNLIDHDIY